MENFQLSYLLILCNLIIFNETYSLIQELDPEVACGLRELDKASSSYKSGSQLYDQEGKYSGRIKVSALTKEHVEEEPIDRIAETLLEFRQETNSTNPLPDGNLRRNESNNSVKNEKNKQIDELPNDAKISGTKKAKNNIKIKTRIVGGSRALIKDFPWIATILSKGRDGGHMCGGTVISRDFVVTSAHCVVQLSGKVEPWRFQIGVGSSYWNKTKRYDVESIIPHPKFYRRNYYNDVALIKVESRIKFIPGKVIPICLMPRDAEVYGEASIAGWGTTNENEVRSNEYLMSADVDILKNQKCKYPYDTFDRDMMICAGKINGGADSCQGDSGGPIQAKLPNGRIYLLGTTSYGTFCGSARYPGVYAKQSVFVDWMHEKMKNLTKKSY